MSKQCYKIEPKTNEYVPLSTDCQLPVSDTCEHCTIKTALYGPVFHVGLKKPFGILLGLCKICAERLTIVDILTDERWKRMQMVLIDHGENIPNRKDVRMEVIKLILPLHSDESRLRQLVNSYPYSYAA